MGCEGSTEPGEDRGAGRTVNLLAGRLGCVATSRCSPAWYVPELESAVTDPLSTVIAVKAFSHRASETAMPPFAAVPF